MAKMKECPYCYAKNVDIHFHGKVEMNIVAKTNLNMENGKPILSLDSSKILHQELIDTDDVLFGCSSCLRPIVLKDVELIP